MTVKAQKLGVFEGKVEVASELKITGTGDGLTKPLAAEPRGWQSGTRLPVLLFVDIGPLTHRPTEHGSTFVRVHQGPAVEGFVLDRIDDKHLADLVADQREAVRLWELEQQRLKDEAKGAIAFEGTEKGGPVDGGDPIETNGHEVVRPEGISDEEWEASARNAPVSQIGSKRASKAKG
jgi:hypothetical protein